MATSKSQRIGIIIIMVVMVVGTVGGFLAMMLSVDQQRREQEQLQAKQEEFNKKMEAYNKRGEEIAAQHYDVLRPYYDVPAKFEKEGIEKVTTEDLQAGDGKTIDKDTKYHALYIGWNPDGKIFDSSFTADAASLKAPLDASGGLIEGWDEGVKGMKLGGVREITIPSDKAYGEAGSGADIAPNTPIKFIVMPIEVPEDYTRPEQPIELLLGGGF